MKPQNTGPDWHQLLVRYANFADVERDERQDEGKAHKGKQLGNEHDEESGTPWGSMISILIFI